MSNTTSTAWSVTKRSTAVNSGAVVDGISPISLYSGMVPNLAFNIAMIVIWGILLTSQILLIWMKQYWFSVAFICTGILEVLGYIGRTWSHYNVYAMNPFLLQMICLTIAPVFTMGGIYYQLAKLIEIYGHKYSLLPSPMAYSYIFICFDIISLAVQAAGGGVAGSESSSGDDSTQGDNIFIAGLALQVASMSIFMMLMAHMYYVVYVETRFKHIGRRKFSFSIFKIKQSEIDYLYRKKYHDLRQNPDRWSFHYFPYALTLSVLTVFVRCSYRLAELVAGWKGYLIIHENYFIILDSLMMSLATTTLTIFHPGFAFLGRRMSIPVTRGHVDPETVVVQNVETDKEQGSFSEEDERTKEKKSLFKRPFREIIKGPFSKKNNSTSESRDSDGGSIVMQANIV